MRKFLFLFVVFLLSSTNVFAFNYNASCHYLDSISGLSTTGDSMGCMSNYKLLDSKSNLAYYTEGSKSDINKIYLVLNVYNVSNKSNMHNSLINASKLLAKKSLNYNLPQPIINSLKSGTPGSWKHGNYTIRVKRDNWPTKLGYEIHFIIEK